MADTCITCKFCDPQDNSEGLCRFGPPTTALVMQPAGPVAMSIHVGVKLGKDWCGKYEQQLVKPAGKGILAMAPRGK